MALTWAQALAWRMRRHLLDPVAEASVAAVVRRLGAVPAWPEDLAELAVRTRRQHSRPGEVAEAVARGEVLKTYAFRGATHLLAPEEGGAFLALRAAGRMWERASWQRHYGLTPADWPELREVVRDALADGPLTRDELVGDLTAHQLFGHLGPKLDGNETLLKALAWQGDLCFGPPRNGAATFQLLADHPRWPGLPELDDAGRWAVESYLRSYGPATPEHVQYWLGDGLGAGRRRVQGWFDSLVGALAEVQLDGETAYLMADDLDELGSTDPTDAVRLLPGHDQWVLGPGTADPHVVPPPHRAVVSRGANLVVAGGVVAGTWSVKGDDVRIAWFPEASPADSRALDEQVARLSTLEDRRLRPVLS